MTPPAKGTRKKRCQYCKKLYVSPGAHKRHCAVAKGERTRTGRAMIREGHPEDIKAYIMDTNGVVHTDDPADEYLRRRQTD